MWSFTRSLVSSLRRPVFSYLTTASFTAIGLFSIAIYALERESNPAITSLFDALYLSVTLMTGVGLGDLAPVTTAGRALAMAMMLVGTAIFVCFTGALAASILELELRHRARPPADQARVERGPE